MSVDLPSSTDPAVAMRSNALIGPPPGHSLRSGPSSARSAPSSRAVLAGSSRERSSILLRAARCARARHRLDPLLRRGLCLLALRASAHRSSSGPLAALGPVIGSIRSFVAGCACWLFARALIDPPPGRSLRSGPSSARSAPSSRAVLAGSSRERSSLEVAFLLAVLHAGLRDAVVGASRAPLRQPGRRDLGDHVVGGRGRGLDTAGAGRVPDRPEAHRGLERVLALGRLDEPVHGQEHAVPLDDLAPVRVVEVRELDLLVPDVGPDVELGPVGEGERADVLALAVPAVVEAPQLRPLVPGIPLAELVAEAEHPLLGPGLLLVAAGAAEDGPELVLVDAAQEGDGLQPVAGRARVVLGHPARVDVVLDAGHDQPQAVLLHGLVPELDDLVEVLAGVDVHDREGHRRRPEGLHGEMQHDDRVLAAGEQQRGLLDRRRDLADDVDGLGLQHLEVAHLICDAHRAYALASPRGGVPPTASVTAAAVLINALPRRVISAPVMAWPTYMVRTSSCRASGPKVGAASRWVGCRPRAASSSPRYTRSPSVDTISPTRPRTSSGRS